MKLSPSLHRALRLAVRAAVALLLAAASLVSLLLISTFIVSAADPPDDPQYIVILGCGLYLGRHVSLALEERLKTGLALYEATPGALIIVSGGRGGDELVSEASAMRGWLLERGVPPSDVIMEENSHNTRENLLYTRDILAARGAANARVTVVTNRFHITRALLLASRFGLSATAAAASTPWQVWHMYLREVPAFFKSLFFDHEASPNFS